MNFALTPTLGGYNQWICEVDHSGSQPFNYINNIIVMLVLSQQVNNKNQINLDILVENAGRVNTYLNRENRKGACTHPYSHVHINTELSS